MTNCEHLWKTVSRYGQTPLFLRTGSLHGLIEATIYMLVTGDFGDTEVVRECIRCGEEVRDVEA